MAAIVTAVAEFLSAGAGLLYGLVYLGIALAYCVQQKEFWAGPNEEDQAHLERASRELWSLSDGAGALQHKFIQLKKGPQLHYLTPRQSPQDACDLVIFLHGFPDCGHLFARQLTSELARTAKLVALDLPGCGGSDSIALYGPNEMLNAVVLAIIELKKRYLGSHATARCILVGHDWGGVVGYRIAAETHGLVSEVVTLNSLYPAYAEEQLKGHVTRGTALLSQWQLRKAAVELTPVLSQLRKSSYTYMLTLPFPMAKFMPRVAFCLLKYAHKMEYGGSQILPPDIVATQLAKAYGPGSLDGALRTADDPGYGPSVVARSKTYPPGDFDQRVKLYSDGLLREGWTQSWGETCTADESGVASKLSSPSTHPAKARHAPATSDSPAAFNYPMTIIFGLKDVALDPRIVLDGIEKYFVAETDDGVAGATRLTDRIIRLPDCGHWSIIEEGGAKALDGVLQALVSKP